MSKKRNSVRKKSSAKSPSQSSGHNRQGTEALMLMHRVIAESRLLKRKRAIFARVLGAKVTESYDVISGASRHMAKLDMAMAEALASAFKMRSLKSSELAMLGKIIVGLVSSVAERFPELVTPVARQTAEAFLCETLEESLQKELHEYLDDPENAQIMEAAHAGRFTEELRKAKSVLDVERVGSSVRLKMYPECVGDLGYFVRMFEPDLESIRDVRKAIELIERRLGQETMAVSAGSNVISINGMACGALSLGSMAGAGDVIGCLEVLISHPSFKTLDGVIEKLNESEQGFLLGGLISQQKILEFEMAMIASHPDFAQMAELVGGYSELMTFDPAITLEALTEREVFVTTVTTDIVRNRSVRAVRAVIDDFVQASLDEDDDVMPGHDDHAFDESESRDWL